MIRPAKLKAIDQLGNLVPALLQMSTLSFRSNHQNVVQISPLSFFFPTSGSFLSFPIFPSSLFPFWFVLAKMIIFGKKSKQLFLLDTKSKSHNKSYIFGKTLSMISSAHVRADIHTRTTCNIGSGYSYYHNITAKRSRLFNK